MTKIKANNLSSALQCLISDGQAKTETARLRDVFDDVEAALKAGIKHEGILAVLHAKGFKMTKASFNSAVQRIRQERIKKI